VDVLQVSGYLDRILVTEIRHAIERAETDGSQALLLQVNSRGGTVAASEIAELADRVRASRVPVAMWVGPSGATAYGAAGQLLGAAAVSGMAPGSHIGRFGTPIVPTSGTLTFGEAGDRLRTGTMGVQDARSSGALKSGNDLGGTAVLGEMIVALDGMKFGTTELHTATLNKAGNGRQPSGNVRFAKLGLVNQMMHTFASKPVAYLLMVIGLALLLFEFFTAGVGIAGVIGAACLIGGCYGLVALPTRGWAVGVLIASFVALAVDVQTGVPRAWTAIGICGFVISSVFLYRDGHAGWFALGTGIAGILLTFLSGMPSMVRTRFATPTIGREWMIGEIGTAVTDINPDGSAQVGAGQWRALTNRATPILTGERLRVIAIDGVTLEVEPEVGGAKDHRERRPAAATDPVSTD
jgi:membrane-bound serine protease (ClpP class)